MDEKGLNVSLNLKKNYTTYFFFESNIFLYLVEGEKSFWEIEVI
jgi:hypothetical protein